MHRRPDAAGGFSAIALIFLVGLIGGIVLNFALPLPIWPSLWIRPIGLAPLIAAIWLFTSARRAFRRHLTALMPWTPSTSLVEEGPYSFSRNPIYLAFIMFYLGLAFLFDSLYVLGMMVVILVLFDRFQIPREERYLQQKFGAEYGNHMSRVRRWV